MTLFAAALGGLLGFGLGAAVATASRTYRDARAATRAARGLWRQTVVDWRRAGAWIGGALIAGFLAIAYWLGRR